MAQAIVDPLELRRFAAQLKKFQTEVQDRLSALHSQMLSLGDTWRDQEHEKFVREFEQTMLAIRHFVEVTEEHVPFLLRKAERIEEYLHQR